MLFFKDANLSFQFLTIWGVMSGFYALLIIFVGPLVSFRFMLALLLIIHALSFVELAASGLIVGLERVCWNHLIALQVSFFRLSYPS